MPASEALMRENDALRERLARLNEAGLRIAADLDLDLETVLREVLDAARSLTGARRGGMTMLDESRALQDFITSGLSEREHAAMLEMPSGLEFFSYLNTLVDPLRVRDISARVAALGMGRLPLSLGSFLSVPIRHRGRHVGSVHLADKEDAADFSADDEETLSMFAAQAAIAIANARRLRDERRARADLETLIDTSPVGVVLFDGTTGTPISFNREARRITDALRDPDQSHEELLDVITYRRGDGREISVADFPMTRAFNTGDAVRAEEIVLRVPDGRRVSTIVNATPIRTADDRVESVVVTLQDLAPLEDVERMRADFLAMVSHELRAPLSSIKGSAATLVQAGASLDPVATMQFHRLIEQQADRMQELITNLLDVARIDSGALAVTPEPVALDVLVDAARGTFLSGGASHALEIDSPLDLPPVMADRRRVVQVLLNLLGNAARRSPDGSQIRVAAEQQDVQVQISVSDEGAGIAAGDLPQLFRTFARRDAESGGASAYAGLGLAISRGIVEAHGGRIWAESDVPGHGAQFHFTLPTTEAAPFDAAPRPGRASDGRPRVLTVDDDPQTLRCVRDSLAAAGYEPILTGHPDTVHELIAEHRPHLVLLNLMLPNTDGMALMQRIPELRALPVIFLSAYGGDSRIARALELGADDYIVKPFSPTELIARIKTVLRRSALHRRPEAETTEPFAYRDLAIDYRERLVTLAGRPLQLTNLEHRMLVELSLGAGRVQTHAELLPRVWGLAHPGRTGAVRTLIRQLRRKLGDDAADPAYIFNVPRVGYRMPKPDGPDPGE
ncbi:MAG: response regulator [Chloroflexi bacterium]|nr:response regulator [Chloroflexota bacterium]